MHSETPLGIIEKIKKNERKERKKKRLSQRMSKLQHWL